MSGISFPEGFRLEPLRRDHPRDKFRSGEPKADIWLSTHALQHQEKHLSATRVLAGSAGEIVGYYTLATGQVNFSDLPEDLVRKMPRRMLPVAVLAWLAVSVSHQRSGLGRRLLAHALRACWEAGKTFAFVAVILDCLTDAVKAFYQRWNFREVPGNPRRLFLSAKQLETMMQPP